MIMRRNSRNGPSVLCRVRLPSAHALQQRRELMPLIVGGMAVFAVGTALNYGYRAFKAMEESKNSKRSSLSEDDDVMDDSERYGHSSAPTSRSKYAQDSIGLDIGSSYARAALRSNDGVSILINSEGKRQTPVAVLLNSFNGDVVVGHIASMQRWAKPSDVSASVHLTIGMTAHDFLAASIRDAVQFPALVNAPDRSSLEFALGSGSLTPNDAYFELVKYMCNNCSPGINTLRSTCVVAVPTYFTPSQRAAVIKTLHRNGISDAASLSDAQCAVAGARELKLWPEEESPDIVIVVDVGGQYTQLSLVELAASSAPRIIQTNTLYGVGADVFDILMAKHVASRFQSIHGIDLLADSMAAQRVYDAVLDSKFELSNKLNSRVNIPFVSASSAGPIHLDETFSRAAYENVINPTTSRIIPAIGDFLQGDIGREYMVQSVGKQSKIVCLLTGGGARVPIVKKEVLQLMKTMHMLPGIADCWKCREIPVVTSEEPEELVSVGAAAVSNYDIGEL